jgi:hypothetical protein
MFTVAGFGFGFGFDVKMAHSPTSPGWLVDVGWYPFPCRHRQRHRRFPEKVSVSVKRETETALSDLVSFSVAVASGMVHGPAGNGS